MEAVIKNSESMQPEDIGHVSYKQTRVVQLSPSTLERNRIVSFDKADPASRAFDMLRTRVMQKMDEQGWRTLAITSPGPEAGKTLVAVNLAMSIAHQTQKTVMLVDFDLRKPKVASYLGLPFGISLNEVLDDKAQLPDALVNPGLPRLVVLPTGAPVAKASETLFSHRVAKLISDLRDRYESRIVIFDLPPLLDTDDAIAVLPQIDCVLMVVGEGQSQKAEIEESLRLIPPEKLLGVVLNKADTPVKPYY
jgi:hypothetical protein